MLTLVLATTACNRSAPDAQKDCASAAPVPSAKPAERGALGDGDLRVLIAELASSKACELLRGQFRPLRADDRPEVVTGVLWIRDCKISNVGTKVSFTLSGNGWQWADQTQHKAGGTFGIRQYVKFGMTATVPGALDVAYARQDHIVSVWFSPSQLPDVTFTPIGGIEVDKTGAWSSIVGAIGGVFGKSPEHLAKDQAETQGSHDLENQLADGLSVTINLCSGLSRFHLGREPKGTMNTPDAGETKRVPIELQQNAFMVFGPQPVGDAGYTANVEATAGAVRATLACRDQAEALAAAYVDGTPLPHITSLATKDIHGKGSLHVARASCMVSLITQPLEGTTPVSFDWQRPLAETARSTGGPLISCEAPTK